MRLFSLLLVSMAIMSPVAGQSAPSGRDLETRTRYEQVLARSPFQQQAFEQVYRSYATHEGLEAWFEALEKARDTEPVAARIVQARIAAHRLEHDIAVALLEEARDLGAEGAPFSLLLGRLYHDTGRDDEAVALLEESLAGSLTADERGRVSRLLGNLLLRKGEREAAIAAWERIAEGAETDVFVLEELAALYESQRMYAEAIRAWERIAALAEADPYLLCRSLRAIGDLERLRGEYAAAAAVYQEALGWVAPDNWLFEAITHSLKETHAVMGDLPGLVEWIEEQLRTDPANVAYRLFLGDTHVRQEAWEKAETAYREAIERAPGQRAGYAALIRMREAHGGPEGIVEAYRKAVARFPGERDYHHRLGLALLRMGEREEGIAAWRAALGDQPQARDHATLAQWFESRGFREEALEAYEDAVALSPHRPWMMRLASLEYEAGRRDAARARWLALADDDAGPDTLLDLAAALEGRGYWEDAGDLLTRALEKAPERMDIALAHADILLTLARFEDAEAAYEGIEERATTDFYRARAERGLLDVIEAQGRMASVRSEWEQQVRDEPENLSVRLRLAQLCERMGDRGRALALYRECAALDPDNPALLQRLARAYESAGNPQEAIGAYRRLVEADPARAGGYYRDLVPLLMQHGTEADAIQAAERLVASAPADPEARMLLARVYERFERGAERLDAHREAVRLAPDEPAYHEALGRAMMDAGNFVEARDSFHAMLDAARDASLRLRAVQQLATAYQRLNRFEDLVDELEARIQRAPRDIEGYELLAAVQRTAGTVFDSLEVLERAAAVADDRETALRRVLVEAHSAGQLDTVVRAFEELSRLSATLDPREWEQLGRAYAQLGREAEAEQAWERMLADHGSDTAVLRVYIRVMQEHGLQEQAFAATERLLAMERHDYRTRLAFAQQLAGIGRVDDAMEQLRMLLHLGEGLGEDAEGEEETPSLQARSQPFQIPAHLQQAAAGTSPSVDLLAALGVGLAPGGGAFNAVYRHSLHLLTQMAARQGAADALVDEYRERVEATPERLPAHHDLLLVLVTLGRDDAMLAHVDAMTSQFPDDPDVLRLAARVFEVHQEFDGAMAMYERLHDAENAGDSMRMSTRIRLLTGAGRVEEARAEVDTLRRSFPEHVGVLRQAASQLAAMDDLGQAEELFRAVGEIDPRHRQTSLQEIAHHYRNRGLSDDARRIYGELLFEPPPPGQASHPPSPGTPALYLPHARQPMSNSVDAVVRVLLPAFNWPRLEAFQQTVTFGPSPEGDSDLLERMAEFVLAPTPEAVADQRAAYEVALLLTGRAIEQGDVDGAMRWIPELKRLGATAETIINIRLLAFEGAQDLTALRKAYQALLETVPEEFDRLSLAVARLAILEENWEEAEGTLAPVLLEPGRQRDVVAMIRQMHDAGEHARAKRLLEVYLTDPNPLPDAFGLRIQVLTALEEHEEAVRLARESWEYTISQQAATRGARMGRIRAARDLQGSDMFALLRNTHAAAGREEELLAFLEEWHERSPNAVPIQLDLAQAYRGAGRTDDALAIYRGLVERRPGDRRLRIALAQVLMGERRDMEAFAIYEEVLRADPSLYQENAWQVRQLYDRLGKSAALIELERRMAYSTTDQNALQQMAQSAAGMGNSALAASLYERLTRLAPGEHAFRLEWADALRRSGDLDGALDAWRSFLTHMAGRPGQTPVEAARAADFFTRMGVRGELETYAEGRLAGDADDPLGLILQVGLALEKGAFPAAMSHLEDLHALRPDDLAVFELMVGAARISGDVDRAIALIDERSPLPTPERWTDLAELYAAKGDADTAYEYWLRDAARVSAQHGIEQTMRRLVDHAMYDKALAHFSQHATQIRGSGSMFINCLQHALRAYMHGAQADDDWLRETLRMIPGNPGWLTGYLTQRNFGLEARRLRALEIALEERPNDPSVARAVLQLRQQGRTDDTMLAMLRHALENDPDNSSVEGGYIGLRLQRGEEDAARAYIEEALERNATPGRLELAFRVHAATEDFNTLLRLRDVHWPGLGEADRNRIGMRWAQTFAMAGDFEFAMEQVHAGLGTGNDQAAMDRLLDMRFRTEDGRSAFGAFENALDEGHFERDGHMPGPAFHIMADTDRLEDLLALLWRHNENASQHHAMVTTQRVVSALRVAGAMPTFTRAWNQRMNTTADASPIIGSLHAIESARRVQMLAWQDELIAIAMEHHPDHWALRQRKAETLLNRGHREEGAAMLASALSVAPLSQQEAIRNALLNALATTGDDEEINRILARTLVMMPLQAHAFGQNAAILAEAGREDEAARAWKLQAQIAANPTRAMPEHALSLIRQGEADAALALYAADPLLGQAHNAVIEMATRGRLDTARALMEIADEVKTNPHAIYPQVMEAMVSSLAMPDLTPALKELRASLHAYRGNHDFASATIDALLVHQPVDAIPGLLAAIDEDGLWVQGARSLALLAIEWGPSRRSGAWIEDLGQHLARRPDALLAALEAIVRYDDKPAARTLLEPLETTDSLPARDLLRLARHAMRAKSPRAPGLYEAAFEQDPGLLLDAPEGAAVLAETGWQDAWDGWLDTARDAAYFPAQWTLVEAALAAGRGDDQTAAARLDSVEPLGHARPFALEGMALWMAIHGRGPLLLPVALRAANGGVQRDARVTIFSAAFRSAAGMGDLPAAAALLEAYSWLGMAPVWSLIEHGAREWDPGARHEAAALLATRQADLAVGPAALNLAYLAWLLEDNATRPSDVAEAWGLTPWQSNMLALAAHSPAAWWVSPRHPVSGPVSLEQTPPAGAKAAIANGTPLDSLEGWSLRSRLVDDPSGLPGTITPLLTAQIEGHGVYLATDMHSPDNRTVWIGSSGDDGHRVWINGAEVVQDSFTGPVIPGEHRYEVPLNAGANRVVVWLANADGPAALSFGIVENGEGVRFDPGADIDAPRVSR